MGVNQRFAAAHRDHGRVAFLSRLEAILQRDHVLQVRRIFADAAAPGAGEVARVQGFQLQNHGEFGCAGQFVPDDMAGNLERQSEGKSHSGEKETESTTRLRPYGTAASAPPATMSGAGGGISPGLAESGVWTSPGSRNVAGETLWDPLTPPQPGRTQAAPRIAIARSALFHLKFIRGTIEALAMFATPISRKTQAESRALVSVASSRRARAGRFPRHRPRPEGPILPGRPPSSPARGCVKRPSATPSLSFIPSHILCVLAP